MALTTAEVFRREGKAEGKAEGKVGGGAKMIITVLATRFGRIPTSVKKAVEGYSDLDALDSLAALAATCKNIEDFKRGLKR